MGNKIFESMTKVQVGEWTVRVWRSESGLSFHNPELEKSLRFREPLEVKVSEIAAKLDALPGIAAYEILDPWGQGVVVYNDWP